jgi:S-formylglutathione hydrolase FrmB
MADLPTRDEARQWFRANKPLAIAAVRRRPPVVTIALVVCIAVTWVRLEVDGQLPTARFITDGFSGRALLDEHFYVLATSTILTRDIFMVVSISVSLLVAMGAYEVVAGHLRAAVLAVVAAALGPTSVMAGMLLLTALGSRWGDSRLDTLDIGASAIVAASSGAIAGIVRDRRLTGGLILFLLGGLAVHHQLADCEHLLIFPWGYLAGRVFGRARIRPARALRRQAVIYPVAAVCLIAVALPASAHLLPRPHRFRSASGKLLSPARIVDTSYPAPSLGGSRGVLVLLPPGYDSTHDHYPVVEFLHGDPGVPSTMVALGGLEADQSASGVAPFIGIAPDGNGPVLKDSWWANTPRQAMGTAVTTDLHAWVTKKYRVTSSWSYAGLSSGGFGAAYLPSISTFPVHGACGLSGWYYDGAIPPLAQAGRAAQTRASPIDQVERAAPLTYLAYGTQDGRARVTTVAYAAALRRAGKHVVVHAYPGLHTWSIWKPAFLACLREISPARAGGGATSPVASPRAPWSPPAPQPRPVLPGESPARMITTTYPSPSLHGNRSVVVLLPPGYDSSPRRGYPVIELLHGDPGNPAQMISWAAIQRSQGASGVAPFIAVAPDGNGPVVKYSWWANIPHQAMGTSVTADLRRWLTQRFRINGSWSYAGLSSGGFGAAYLPLISAYPVHGVCGLSGYYTGNIPPIPASDKALQEQVSPIAHLNRVASITFIAYGQSDNRTIDGSKVYVAALRKAHTKVVVQTYPGGHDWHVWTAGFLGCFRTLEPAS